MPAPVFILGQLAPQGFRVLALRRGKKWPKLYEVELVEVDNSDDMLRKVRRTCIK